jgi:hypothetical protein
MGIYRSLEGISLTPFCASGIPMTGVHQTVMAVMLSRRLCETLVLGLMSRLVLSSDALL